MKKKTPQTELILNHLLKGNTLTILQSLALFDCVALSQACGYLRLKKGYPIVSEMITTNSGKRIARYSMDDQYRPL